jgi:hypothetical protein
MQAIGVRAIVLAFFAFAGQSAFADVSVSSLGMGHGAPSQAVMGQFEALVRKYNESGERFKIDTYCPSACTMFLGIRNVCIAPGAVLAFHSGGSMQLGIVSYADTQRMLNNYNAVLRKYVIDNHFTDTFTFHRIAGAEIVKRFGYPACH